MRVQSQVTPLKEVISGETGKEAGEAGQGQEWKAEQHVIPGRKVLGYKLPLRACPNSRQEAGIYTPHQSAAG